MISVLLVHVDQDSLCKVSFEMVFLEYCKVISAPSSSVGSY